MIRLATFLLCLFVTAQAARAEVVYDVFFRSTLGDSLDDQYSVDPGAQFQADIILRESVTGTSSANIGANGLGGLAYRIGTAGGDGTFNITARPTFQLTTFNTSNTVGGANLFGSIVPVQDLGSGVFEANIGTVSLTAPNSGVTQFTLSDPRPESDFAGLGQGNNIDDAAVSFRSMTLSSITAIPEPSSALMLAGFGGVALLRRRRRR